jgi:acetylornithine/N-succinyldiaminopimelate aminotransferase
MKLFDVYPLFPIEPATASGCWITANDGTKYLDLYGGHAVISIGHSHPHYVNRLTEQLNKIAFYSNSVENPIQVELAEKLGTISGYPDYNLFLCNSGAEANENAFKLASFHTGRKKIIAFSNAFHGRTSLAVAATDDPKITAAVNQNSNIQFLPFNDEAAFEQAMNDEVCAVIIEGIQGVGGVHVPETSFLKKIKTLCNRYGAMMILDEIQSGYGRSGKFFAHQHAGVKPDIITVAKGMGNGFPIAGVLITPEIKPAHSMLGTTFGGNYLACVAALAVLEVLESENLIQHAVEMGDYIKSHLINLPGLVDIRGNGLMIGLELDQPCAGIRSELLVKHHIFTGSASQKNTLRILPPLNLKKEEADLFIQAFTSVLTHEIQPS